MANPGAALCVMKGLQSGGNGFGAYQTKLEKVYKPDPKKDDGKWEFVHWPIKCRANFSRLILEECDVDYIDNYGDDYCKKQISSPLLGTQKPDFSRKYEAMGPPFLRKVGDPNSFISQSIVMAQYLANEYGLRPKSNVHHHMAGMVVANCLDIFEELKSKSIQFKGEYNKFNKDKCCKCKCNSIDDDEKIHSLYLNYLNGRLSIWFSILLKPLTLYKNQKYYFDNKITQADLALYNIMDMLLEWMSFAPFHYFILNRYPVLHMHYVNMNKNSNGVKKLISRQKKEKVLWWPYYGADVMGIELAGKIWKRILKKALNKRKNSINNNIIYIKNNDTKNKKLIKNDDSNKINNQSDEDENEVKQNEDDHLN